MKPTLVVNQSLIQLIVQGVTGIYEPEVHMTQTDRRLNVTIWWRPLHRRGYPRVPMVIPCDFELPDCQLASYVIDAFLQRITAIEKSPVYRRLHMKDVICTQ